MGEAERIEATEPSGPPEREGGPRSALARARPLVLARAFSAAITFFIPLVLARLLTLAEYGTFKQFFLVTHTLYLMLGLGIPQSLYYFLPRCAPGERRAFLGQTLLYLLVAGSLGGVALALAKPVLLGIGGPALAVYAVPMGIYSALLLAGGALEAGLTAQGKPERAAATFAISDTAKMLLFLLPAFWGFGLSGVLWGAALYGLGRAVASWGILVAPLRGPLARKELGLRQWRYALPFGGAMLLAMPQQQLHQYVVSVLSDPAVFAIYAVGCFNLPIVDLLYTPTTELLMFQIGELERNQRPEREAAWVFRDAVGKLAFVFLPIAAGLFAIAPAFITLLYTEKFSGAVPIFRIAVCIVALACFPVDGVLRAKARTRTLFVSYLAKLGVSVPLVVGLALWIGPIGAMAGFILTEFLHRSALLCLAARTLVPDAARAGAVRGTWRALVEVLPLRRLLHAAVGALLAAGLVLLGNAWSGLSPLHAFFVWGLTFWAAYLVWLLATGVRPSQLLALVRGRP